MTDLLKPVSRRTRTAFGHYRWRIVVTLEPGDCIALRLERARLTHRASLADVFRQVADWHAQAEARRKREERKRRKAT